MLNCWFSFKQVKHSDDLVAQAEPRLMAKIEKYATKAIDAHVTFTQFSPEEYSCRCVIKGGDGFNIQVEAHKENLNSAFDTMLHRLETQLKRQKDKIKRHKYDGKSLKVLPPLEVVDKEWDDEVDAEDLIKFVEATDRRKA